MASFEVQSASFGSLLYTYQEGENPVISEKNSDYLSVDFDTKEFFVKFKNS